MELHTYKGPGTGARCSLWLFLILVSGQVSSEVNISNINTFKNIVNVTTRKKIMPQDCVQTA